MTDLKLLQIEIDELISWLGKTTTHLEQRPDIQMVLNAQVFLYDVQLYIMNKGTNEYQYSSNEHKVDINDKFLKAIELNIFSRENKLPKQLPNIRLIPGSETPDIHITKSIANKVAHHLILLNDAYLSIVVDTLHKLSRWLYLIARSQTKVPNYVTSDRENGPHYITR